MNCEGELDPDCSEFVEVDPTGRYGRYNEILGKGASKTVYRAFDEYEGIEVAWNQVKLNDFLQSPEELERLYCEIHLLKTLKHSNIMKFYTSWVDPAKRNINFVTEMFTSGTLRQYRLKHRRVNIRAVKHWCRQILKGLLYLHSHKPPVIHRDLKCDNIFVNGNQGEVKIGDLGLAAILRKSHAAHCVGTPEFMAPEVYEEEYNELVDIYSFGMCILEMVTFEYPYSECTHPAQIYKKVISGKKPDALFKVKDPEVRQFVEKCLATVTLRLSAWELLKDPFLQTDDYGSDFRPIDYQRGFGGVGPLIRLGQPRYDIHHDYSSLMNGFSSYSEFEPENGLVCDPVEFEKNEIELFSHQEDEHLENVDISIKGRKRDDQGIFLRLRISDKEGRVRNIYFPFDIETDTALSVATEMISELDITDQDVTKIADMIDGEIASLVPGWNMGLSMDESENHAQGANFCHHCSPLSDYVSSNNSGTKNVQVLQCSKQGCANVHGRFEEITYQVEGSEECVTEGPPVVSSHSDGMQYADIWAQREGPELSSEGSREIHSDEEGHESSEKSIYEKDEKVINIDSEGECDARKCSARMDDYENEIRQELRWLKAKYQMQLRELRDQQLGTKQKLLSIAPNLDSFEQSNDMKVSPPLPPSPLEGEDNAPPALKSFPSWKRCNSYLPDAAAKGYANFPYQRPRNCEQVGDSCGPDDMMTAKNFYKGELLPQPLHRATSLPVDAVDC